MRKLVIITAGLVVAVGVVTASTVARADTTRRATPATATIHYSLTGSIVAGVKSAQAGQVLAFDFTAKNTGSKASEVDFYYSLNAGAADDALQHQSRLARL